MSCSSMIRWAILGLFMLGWGAAVWRAPAPSLPVFVAPPSVTGKAPAETVFHAEMLPKVAVSAHAATLAQLADGRLVAAWFAGSREGADDVAIWFSTRTRDGWSAPVPIANRQMTVAATRAHARKVGNPVLFAHGDRLHLWFVSVGLGGWAGSAINHAVSDDGGQTWSVPQRLILSPLANISTLVRTPPVLFQDGGFGLAVYHEFIAKHGEWLRLSPSGEVIAKTRMVHPLRTLQPAVAVLDEQRAVALLRDASPREGRVQMMQTRDAGLHWEVAAPLPLPNPNASIALLRLTSGRLLLAANGEDGRETLQLWVSADEGASWTPSQIVERARLAEFSYPALLQAQDGLIHLAYTWRREGIKHVTFSEAWLDSPAEPKR